MAKIGGHPENDPNMSAAVKHVDACKKAGSERVEKPPVLPSGGDKTPKIKYSK